MRWIRQILVVIVWLAASWPCTHLLAGDGHDHDHAGGIELCASAGHDCECHGCREVPCTDQASEHVERAPAGSGLWLKPVRSLCFVATSPVSSCRPAPMVPLGSTTLLKTVRLLI